MNNNSTNRTAEKLISQLADSLSLQDPPDSSGGWFGVWGRTDRREIPQTVDEKGVFRPGHSRTKVFISGIQSHSAHLFDGITR